MTIDLLKTVESGGCSIKLPAAALRDALKDLPKMKHEKLLVDIETHDDAGVYQISDDIALILTTDFFSPICSDPYEFGQIAAANALSDVYAMGGEAITALNLMMFPANLDLKVMRDILAGGQDKVKEAGAVIAGGHTITDSPVKYGLAVTGIVHPNKIIANANARPGEKLVLTKALGIGVLVAAKKFGGGEEVSYRKGLESMKLLNKNASAVMQEFNIRCATDITGFGLLGHALKLAQASKVSLKINSKQLPLLDRVYELIKDEYVSGVTFKNLDFVKDDCEFSADIDNNLKLASLDPQTSGGILMSVPDEKVDKIIAQLKEVGYPATSIVGEVVKQGQKGLYVS
ncbi:MAG: selenide, water dikinase SelD [Candidatus Margulisiibacteriota bacterium]